MSFSSVLLDDMRTSRMAEPMFIGLILAQPRKHRKKGVSRKAFPDCLNRKQAVRLPVGVSPAPTFTSRGANPPPHPTAALQEPLDRLAFAARIGENTISTKRPKLIMPSPEKIPKIMAEKFAAITKLTDEFCSAHLDEEYRRVIQRVVGALARKRPSPLVKGKDAVWAGAAVHAVGRVNYLDDPSQSPHCKPKVIYEFFGIGESTGQNKSREIRELLKMGPMSPEWTLPSRIADNPLVWMVQFNGLIVDVRGLPIELKQMAFEKGLIPYVPAAQSDRT